MRSSEGYGSTILDGGGNGKTVKIIETTNLEGLQVIGFTIQNGFAEYTGSTDRGGGMEISSADKTVIISDCYFTNNRSDEGGAHIKIDGDNVFINRSIFVNGLGGTPIFSDNGRKSGYFTNCLIDANGEAHVVDGNSFPDFYHSTLQNYTGFGYRAGKSNSPNGVAYIVSSILATPTSTERFVDLGNRYIDVFIQNSYIIDASGYTNSLGNVSFRNPLTKGTAYVLMDETPYLKSDYTLEDWSQMIGVAKPLDTYGQQVSGSDNYISMVLRLSKIKGFLEFDLLVTLDQIRNLM